MGLDLTGRSKAVQDTMMVATVSPEDQQTTIVGIAPRILMWTLSVMVRKTKINHAYAFGGPAYVDGYRAKIFRYRGPVDHYISIIMAGSGKNWWMPWEALRSIMT